MSVPAAISVPRGASVAGRTPLLQTSEAMADVESYRKIETHMIKKTQQSLAEEVESLWGKTSRIPQSGKTNGTEAAR